MSKIAEALQLLKNEFAERYGVDIRMDIYIHDASETLARQITRDMILEFGSGVYERGEKGGYKWKSWRDDTMYTVSINVFHSMEGETNDEGRV